MTQFNKRKSSSNVIQSERQQHLKDQERMLKTRMGKIKHKIAVISGKGGVGKSLVTVNLATALALAKNGYKVGILDADIHGPTVPKMLGVPPQTLKVGPPGAFPAEGPNGIRVVSMDFLLNEETPIIWRGPLKMSAIRQLLTEITWGNLDFLLIDLPPGTGDEPLSVIQLLPEMDGVIIVTMPSDVSQRVVRKAVTFARQLRVPIIGIVENMSGFRCPHCQKDIPIFSEGGGKKIADEMQVPFLGKIPIDPNISDDADCGKPFITKHPQSPATVAFKNIVENVIKGLNMEKEVITRQKQKG